mmetsp:Transcript_1955/g.2705  ORF Transcript_1955/g.2705 Transcript_1955/m.2705 type:complete len:169 (+) Transcript_1955:91-597(+)|eukprot:CAMPEP_0179415794 /NCGR_PEP_ID=MMETSP0799-20121207/6443_1 /TAXON_ID=46947 /ORGANISM="Geminigera cryophila, Strain CCMP2564" /LENGTH=168 /DNA_ID=CAMNT_0021188599 /DNA_START=75 /DNA_END=581 /DNA_ORIENTATION=-
MLSAPAAMPFAAELAQQKRVADVRQKLVADNIVDSMDTSGGLPCSPLSPDRTLNGSSLLLFGGRASPSSVSSVTAVPGSPLSVESLHFTKDDEFLAEHLYALRCESDQVATHERLQFTRHTVDTQSASDDSQSASRVDPAMKSQNPLSPVSYFLAQMTGSRGNSQNHL